MHSLPLSHTHTHAPVYVEDLFYIVEFLKKKSKFDSKNGVELEMSYQFEKMIRHSCFVKQL